MIFRNYCLFLLFLFHISSLHAIVGHYECQLQSICCSSDLKQCWKKILQLPEARLLINKVQKEGIIALVSNNDHHLTKKFGAFWDPSNRIITINSSSHRSEADLIISIIFELHNASSNKHLTRLHYLAAAGAIDRESYVQSVEKIEYQNALNASILARKGVDKGVFPENTLMQTYPTFEEHYKVQKAGGHSSHIAHNYIYLAFWKKLND